MSDTLLIRNVRPAGGAATDVLVRDGRIAAIGAGAAGIGADATFDAGGRLMIPGLVEAHTHLDKSFWGMGWQRHTAGPALIDKIETERRNRRELGIDAVGVPDRSIRPQILRPLLKACREGLRLETEYVSLANPEPEVRLIAPHTLVYTGMRWHVRAYCEKNGKYRDFVLSRLRGEPELLGKSDNPIGEDHVWQTAVDLVITPDQRLAAMQRAIIEADFGMLDGQLVIPSRQALVKYVLQRYQIDPKNLDPKPEAQQIVVKNLQELKPWLYD